MARPAPRPAHRPARRTAAKAMTLGAAGALLLFAAGCMFHPDPAIDADIKRSYCNVEPVPFTSEPPYPMIQGLVSAALCEIMRPEATVETQDVKWPDMCRDAAAGGGAARSALAWHYRNGWSPAPRDRVEAYKWFALSADAGFAEAAGYRDELGAELTPDERAEAETRLAAWSPADESCPV